jgi:peptide/nickel transport system substrate-binding protein
MYTRKKWLILMLLFVIVAGFGFAAPDKEESETSETTDKEMVLDPSTGEMVEKPQYGGTINLRHNKPPKGYDPWRYRVGWNQRIFGSVYEEVFMGVDWAADRSKYPLVMYAEIGATKGYIMESFEEPDPLTYIVHIRKGIKFQDKEPVFGRELTAHDIKYCMDRYLGYGEFVDQGPTPYVTFAYWDQEYIKELEVVDDYTVVIHMKKPAAVFTNYWGAWMSPWVYPREMVDTYGNDFGWEHVVGHGVWILDEYVTDVSVNFLRNPNYYQTDDKWPENKIPYADAMKIFIIPEWSTTVASLRTGKIDKLDMSITNGPLEIIASNPELQWIQHSGGCGVVNMRVDLEPYSDIRVRKAMQMAVNLPELAESLYEGFGGTYPSMINGFASPSLWTPLEELPEDCQEAFTYNPERAKELLAEAGYAEGFKQVFPQHQEWDLGTAFVAYWEAIGIETEMKMMETAAFNAFRYGGNHEICRHWSCNSYETHVASTFFTGGQASHEQNFSNVDDPVFNKMWDDIFAEPDATKRSKLMKEAFAYGTCQFWYVAGPTGVGYKIWSPWLKGYSGESRMQGWGRTQVMARLWVDQDLKEEMIGVRD